MSSNPEILLGDNPFFGIDHLSQDRARNRMSVLNGADKIAQIIQFAVESGVNGFVVSTHPQLKELIKFLYDNTDVLKNLQFYPILPYAQGYVSKVTEKGVIGAANDILSGGSIQEKLKIVLKGSLGFLKKDFDKLFQAFIDVELIPLGNVQKKTIFLHDVVTDLAISLEMKEIINEFINYIKKRYETNAGLVTKNFPRLVDILHKWDIEIPTIMTSFNKLGNQMNPSKEKCEMYLRQYKPNVIAMNVLAGGIIKPNEAAQYSSGLGINRVVVGMSSTQHVTETLTAFRSI